MHIRGDKEKSRVIIYQLLPRLFSNTSEHNVLYGSAQENGCGKMNHISAKALDEIHKLGATFIWYTGMIEHATCTDYSNWGIRRDNPLIVKGVAGSPYAIKDYYDIAPDLAEDVAARMKEFEQLVKRTHDASMGVIIDFVPNHVAREYFSDAMPEGEEGLGEKDNRDAAFLRSNNFYYLPGEALELPPEVKDLPYVKVSGKTHYTERPARATGNDQFIKDPSFHDWYETVKLNYGFDFQNKNKKHFKPTPDTWYKMRDILLFWAGKGVDGFRCDMAEMVPVEFWQWVIPQVKEKYPAITFIAEIYSPKAYKSYIDVGMFDYLYDKIGMYDTLRGVITGQTSARMITRVWQENDSLNSRMVRFLENHDEQRIASSEFAGSARGGFPAMALVALMHTGPVMVYFGQECGEPAEGRTGFSGDDGRTSIFDYCHVPHHSQWINKLAFDGGAMDTGSKQIRQFYERLINLAGDEVFSYGAFYDLMWANPDSKDFDGRHIYCFLRYTPRKVFLVLTNFDAQGPVRVNIRFPEDVWELLDKKGRFSIYGKDVLWDQKEFFSDSIEVENNGLVFVIDSQSVYAFELDISVE